MNEMATGDILCIAVVQTTVELDDDEQCEKVFLCLIAVINAFILLSLQQKNSRTLVGIHQQ